MVWAAISRYSVSPIIITLHGQITAREYMDRVGNQIAFRDPDIISNYDAVFEKDNASIHTAGTVQSWFEEREGEPQYLPWPAQSPDLNVTEPSWSVFGTTVRNRIPPPTSQTT
jgi:hypothetical protein